MVVDFFVGYTGPTNCVHCLSGACHLLFGITQCYIYFLYISYFTNICQFGCLDIIKL